MKRTALLLSLWLYPATGWSQSASLTAADLVGATVDAKVTMDQVIQREGRQFPVQLHQQIKVTFLDGDTIEWSLTPVSDTPRGRRQGPTRRAKTSLGKPRDTNTLGGGQALWFFEDNTLILIRTYGGAGGYKRTISFERKGDGFACTARETFMREEGVGRVSLRSAIDDVPVVIVNAKMASSSCKVTLKKPAAG